MIEFWRAIRQAFSNWQVHPKIDGPRGQPVLHDRSAQLHSEPAPHGVGSISIGKELSAATNGDLPGKDYFYSLGSHFPATPSTPLPSGELLVAGNL